MGSSPTQVEVLGTDSEDAASAIYALQVTTGSVLRALAYNCGGLLIEHGWLRILGGGTTLLPSLAAANALGDPA